MSLNANFLRCSRENLNKPLDSGQPLTLDNHPISSSQTPIWIKEKHLGFQPCFAMDSNYKYTVWHAFYDILRGYGINHIFGNPGSTEQPMLKNFPKDFKYVLGLQEASVVAMADGYAQATRKVAVASLHTGAGTGNAMCSIMTAFLNKTPMLIVAGQQTRQMLIGDPLLANRQSVELPKPCIKWSYEPVRAEDVPAAIVRGIITATAAPAGPVYLSIPLDDWDAGCGKPVIRSVTTSYGPDPLAIVDLAKDLRAARSPALVLGSEVDRSLAWNAVVTLAEHMNIPVYQAPASDRAVFPELHPLYRGLLPPAKGPISARLRDHDFLLVVGSEIWRYYPYVPGEVVVKGTRVVQITNDPHDASSALVGDSIMSDVRLAIERLNSELNAEPRSLSDYESPKGQVMSNSTPMTPLELFSALADLRPKDAILLQESPSNAGELLKLWPAIKPESYFTFASGGLGWDAPAAVGVALAQPTRPVILVVGDGSLHYSVQSIYTAVQHKRRLIYVVPKNEEYAVLKEFAELEKTPGVPALDLVGLDAVAIARAYGCHAEHVQTRQEVQDAFREALARNGPSLIEVPISKDLKPLMGIVTAS